MSSTAIETDSNPRTVLIVDDVLQNRMLLKRILEKHGYQTAEATDGKECLEWIKKFGAPHTILLDIMMPELDGISVCKELRNKYAKDELPIILVTAKSEAEDIAEGLKSGASDYVTKPIDRTVLLARLKNQIALQNSRRELTIEKRKLESALSIQKSMGDMLPEAIVIEDDSGSLVYANQQARVLCSGELPTKIQAFFEVVWGGGLVDGISSIREKIAKNSGQIFFEELSFGLSAKKYIQLRSKPIDLGAERPGRLWLLDDVTHTRQLERKMKEHMRLETVSLFATGVAHNFNNIMGGIQGATELLQNVVKGNRIGEKCISIINKAIAQGSLLTGKMMTFKKDRVGGDELSEDINRLLFQVAEIQRQLIGDRITFVLLLDPSIPKVAASAKNLIDILSNVVSNSVDAIQYSGAITLKTRYECEAGLVWVEISDTGVGMDEDLLEKAFQPFFSTKQIDHVNGMSMGGNGLGLWNVYNLSNMLGGDVQLRSEPGIGTTVTLRFPAVACADQSVRQETEAVRLIS